MNLSEIIKKYRSENHLSMDELAKRCDLSKGYISMLENQSKPSGRTKNIVPSIQAIRKLSKGMNMEFDYLLASIENVSLTDDTTSNTQFGNNEANRKYLEDKPELLEIYNEFVNSDDLRILFDKTKDLEPKDVESVLMFVQTIRNQRGMD